MSASATLGSFVAEFRAAIPATIRHEAKRAIVNHFGVALGGGVDPAGDQALDVLLSMAGKPAATVIGSAQRLDMLNAAFLNALNANVLDFDDTHMPTVIHPTAPVAPPLFSLAEQTRISGADLLDAFVLGVEVACRAGNAVSPAHYARGWHITATCGVMGAAAAAARLMRLDAEKTAHAIGIAASQAGGLVENLPNGAKNVQVGNSARNGLFAALLARRGYTAAPQTIEGVRGWARAMGDAIDLKVLLDGLGETWELTRNALKAYPCGIVLAPVIDACLELRTKHRLAPDDIAEVVVSGNSLLLARADRPAVSDERIAKLSIQHSAAIAFVRGAAGVAEFHDFAAPELKAFRARVRAQADDQITIEQAIVSVTTRSGERLQAHIRHARGSLETPLTDQEVEAKLRALARLGAPRVDVDPLVVALWALDTSPDAGAVMRLAMPAS
jgi:2-methylcitrate dehydratase PrpD